MANTSPHWKQDKRESIEIPDTLRSPHPVVKRLIDDKQSIPVPSGQRRRALLIAHALAAEAIRRGWVVESPSESAKRDAYSEGWHFNNLFTINAGHRIVGVRLRMKLAQVLHVQTAEEKRHQERWGYSYARKYDHVETETLRLEMRPSSYRCRAFEDTSRASIESKLLRALDVVQRGTDEQIAMDEERRAADEAREEGKRRHELLVSRFDAYDARVHMLRSLSAEWRERRLLDEFLTYLEASGVEARPEDRDRIEAFVEWSRQHLRDADSSVVAQLPVEPAPDLDYATWADGRPDKSWHW